MEQSRRIAVILHPSYPEAFSSAAEFILGMGQHGITCLAREERINELREWLPGANIELLEENSDVELIVVFGGDGSILRAAEWALPQHIPLLGVNLGHVGFLAELDPSQIDELIRRVVARDYGIEKRLTLDVTVHDPQGNIKWQSFAVNEVTAEKASRQRMVDVQLRIDGKPLSKLACDGVIVATPSGSTAYGYSCGGPVMWPNIEAFEVVPIAAHELFSRSCVVAPTSTVELRVIDDMAQESVIWCDGRRTVDLDPDDRVVIRKNAEYLQIARLHEQPFTARLVKKFGLKTEGWRAPEQQTSSE